MRVEGGGRAFLGCRDKKAYSGTQDVFLGTASWPSGFIPRLRTAMFQCLADTGLWFCAHEQRLHPSEKICLSLVSALWLVHKPEARWFIFLNESIIGKATRICKADWNKHLRISVHFLLSSEHATYGKPNIRRWHGCWSGVRARAREPISKWELPGNLDSEHSLYISQPDCPIESLGKISEVLIPGTTPWSSS